MLSGLNPLIGPCESSDMNAKPDKSSMFGLDGIAADNYAVQAEILETTFRSRFCLRF